GSTTRRLIEDHVRPHERAYRSALLGVRGEDVLGCRLIDVAEPARDGQHERMGRRAEPRIDPVDLKPGGSAEHRAVAADAVGFDALEDPGRSWIPGRLGQLVRKRLVEAL